jgi:hypothetical protein
MTEEDKLRFRAASEFITCRDFKKEKPLKVSLPRLKFISQADVDDEVARKYISEELSIEFIAEADVDVFESKRKSRADKPLAESNPETNTCDSLAALGSLSKKTLSMLRSASLAPQFYL